MNRRRRRDQAAKPQSFCQRVEDNAFHLSEVDRLLRRRWEMDRRKAQISGGRAADFVNALRTTRSTYFLTVSHAVLGVPWVLE
jgi:hypothetical protein